MPNSLGGEKTQLLKSEELDRRVGRRESKSK